MATEEGWVGISKVAAYLLGGQGFGLPLDRFERVFSSPNWTSGANPSLGSGRVGEG